MTERLEMVWYNHEGLVENMHPATPAEIDKAAGVTELRQQLAAWVALGRRMSAVISEPDNVHLWDLTCLWKNIDDAIAAAEPQGEQP